VAAAAKKAEEAFKKAGKSVISRKPSVKETGVTTPKQQELRKGELKVPDDPKEPPHIEFES
jgi:hypothetical protein